MKKLIKKILLFILSPWVVTRYDDNFLHLTFDDGPNKQYTEQVLDILKSYNIKAEFYLIGRYISDNKKIIQRMIDEGHIVANHSYSHQYFRKKTFKEVKNEISQTDNILSAFVELKNKKFRPPQGVINLNILLASLVSKHKILLWDFDSLDYQNNEEVLQNRLISIPGLQQGSIVLMHDDNPLTISFLPGFINECLTHGYKFLPITGKPD